MSWDHSLGKTAQEQHNEKMTGKPRMARGSKKKLEAMLKAKGALSDRSHSDAYDWVGALQKQHPTLTDEKIAEMAEAFGL